MQKQEAQDLRLDFIFAVRTEALVNGREVERGAHQAEQRETQAQERRDASRVSTHPL
jgi:hypothetical protein